MKKTKKITAARKVLDTAMFGYFRYPVVLLSLLFLLGSAGYSQSNRLDLSLSGNDQNTLKAIESPTPPIGETVIGSLLLCVGVPCLVIGIHTLLEVSEVENPGPYSGVVDLSGKVFTILGIGLTSGGVIVSTWAGIKWREYKILKAAQKG
jgi:hypothetical protein